MEQRIQFCTTDDGVRIAYATSGKGPPLVKSGSWLTHLEYDLKSPVHRSLYSDLSEQHTLVRYDPRGTGMSDRDVSEVSPELWLKDLEAVVRAQNLEKFALIGYSQGGAAAVRYAAIHPDKITHLIVYGGYARGRLLRKEADFGPEMLDAMCTLILKGWGSDNDAYRELFSARFVSSNNREHIRWLNELEAMSASPEMAAKYFRALVSIDVRHLLPQVKAPTLVLHCRGDRAAPFESGRELAAGIPGARFVPMDGDNHIFLEHEPAYRTLLTEVHRFLGDKRKFVTKVAVERHARNWSGFISRVHHAIEPYYVIAAVASLVVGAVSYIVTRIM